MRMIHYGKADIASGEGLTPIVSRPACGRIRILSVGRIQEELIALRS